MHIYRTQAGWELDTGNGKIAVPPQTAGRLTTREDLSEYLAWLAGVGAAQTGGHPMRAPIEEQEVWAAGVTYFRSRTARMAESAASGGMSFYDRVYNAERPELFFKSTPHRVVGPGDAVRIRHDSKWNVPEPELTLLVSPGGKILGYTVGNDMSSRDIEGENPLYLPQAKVYDRSCALGPGILISAEPLAPATGIHIDIRRDGASGFADSTTLAEMKRRPAELVEYLFRENSFPNGCFLLTGTGIVPPNSFTLAAGDEIAITIEGIGTLTNPVG
jgi:2-dehydro-3-deoxy-D-arabinonate dehydratase